jgi:proteic killer suppression protein
VGAVESLIGINKQIVYNSAVIESFASDETENLFATGKSRRLPPEILKRALMRLTQLHAATEIDDLRMPPSNRLEALVGELAGKWSIRVNDRWRLCFRFEGGHAYEVEIVDYH